MIYFSKGEEVETPKFNGNAGVSMFGKWTHVPDSIATNPERSAKCVRIHPSQELLRLREHLAEGR